VQVEVWASSCAAACLRIQSAARRWLALAARRRLQAARRLQAHGRGRLARAAVLRRDGCVGWLVRCAVPPAPPPQSVRQSVSQSVRSVGAFGRCLRAARQIQRIQRGRSARGLVEQVRVDHDPHHDKNRSARLRLRCVYVAAQIRATERAARLREAELVVERTLTARRVQALQRGRRQRRRYLTPRRAALDIQRAARGRAARGVAASVRREHAAARRMQVTEIPLRFYAVCSS
jgi:hypothetical protein